MISLSSSYIYFILLHYALLKNRSLFDLCMNINEIGLWLYFSCHVSLLVFLLCLCLHFFAMYIYYCTDCTDVRLLHLNKDYLLTYLVTYLLTQTGVHESRMLSYIIIIIIIIVMTNIWWWWWWWWWCLTWLGFQRRMLRKLFAWFILRAGVPRAITRLRDAFLDNEKHTAALRLELLTIKKFEFFSSKISN